MATTAFIRCPHCGDKMLTHNHVTHSPLFKRLTAQCRNHECAFSSYVDVTISQQLHNSRCPKSEIEARLNKT